MAAMNDSPVVEEPYRYGAVALRSAFQPIFSFAHRRVVGHEALLRAVDSDGRSVSPIDMFARCASTAERDRLDQACRVLHAREFAKTCSSAEWLFLNVDASLFDPGNGASASQVMRETAACAKLAPEQIVIEILEGAVPDGPEFEEEVSALKSTGFLIAMDDFGAGHSNFDRVFRLRPHIVKMDRSVILAASRDATVRRVTTQMISLLHECGALVLVEGVETQEEAFVALDAEADFVQGYYFGRPQAAPLHVPTESRAMTDAWMLSEERAGSEVRAYRERMQPYADAIELAARKLQSGQAMEAACSEFLQLEDAEVCFLVDDSGRQIGANHLPSIRRPDHATQARFAPLLDVRSACWSRRPYFRRAVANPGQLQVTRPYLTMQSLRMCVTLSMSVPTPRGNVIVCGDVVWHTNASPGHRGWLRAPDRSSGA
jgi:EAL domain-containing protein (putative c-di-GMP-specific phosphodiesterase class I)